MPSTRFSRTLLSTLLGALALLLAAGAAQAQSPVDALGRCLADNTSGRDRKELARWLFAAMTAHPEMKSLSAASGEDIDRASRSAGALFTRLLADNCPGPVRDAVRSGGPAAIQAGFQVLGQLAMQELMTNPQVGSAMGILDRYIDRAKVEAAMQQK